MRRASFAERWIPEPPTLWDSYATPTDALRENEQTIARDPNNRDRPEIPTASAPTRPRPPSRRAGIAR